MQKNQSIELNAETAMAGGRANLSVREALVEVLLRCATFMVLACFAYAGFGHWMADPTRITLLLIVVAACLTLGLTLFARVPMRRDWSPLAIACSLSGTFYFLFVDLGPGVRVVPEVIGASIQITGILWQIFAKISLRGSFGLLPANRGIVSHGAYRVVRHPIYLGYLVADIGFLLANFGMQNVVVFSVLYLIQAVRIIREERLLYEDPEYRHYAERVRYRVLPGLI